MLYNTHVSRNQVINYCKFDTFSTPDNLEQGFDTVVVSVKFQTYVGVKRVLEYVSTVGLTGKEIDRAEAGF